MMRPSRNRPCPRTPETDTVGQTLLADAKAYFSAPLRWDRSDWGWFAGSLAAIGAAHHYDTQVRTHFIKTEGPTVGSDAYDLQDALPAVAVAGGHLGVGGLHRQQRRTPRGLVDARGRGPEQRHN